MKTALVVIDVQKYFVNENTQDLPSRIRDYINKNNFDFIIFSKEVNNKNSNFFKLLNWKKMFSSPDTDIHPTLSKFANSDNTFEKSTYSIFKAKGFLNFLKKHNISRLYFCGIDIDACVLASAFDAFDFGYEIKVLKDLSKSHSGKDLDEAALKIINKNLDKSGK
ncbi:MAG: isochorismatase family cysteine hydrolase [Patescibacteria group bacterium]